MTKDVVAYVDHVRELGVPCLNAAGPLASFGAAANLGYGELISNRVVDAIGDLAGGVRLHSAGQEKEAAAEGERVMTADAGGVAAGMVIGFVGLGNMGIPMTRRLVAAGYQVRGFDTSAEALRNFAAIGSSDAGGGVTAIAELGSVADGADAVDPDAALTRTSSSASCSAASPASRRTRRALAGLLASLAAGATVIDMSSSDPARTQALAPLCAAAGVTLIDAPVSGGVAGARAGTLAVMVGGPAAAFDRF